MAVRFVVELMRANLHAALVVTVAAALFLLFVLWGVLQLFDSSQ